MHNETILIIDDDVQIGDLEQELLEREGYRTLRAYSGTEALLLLEKERPALVLLDLMLPGLSGEELLPKLQGIPVIVVSAKPTVEDKVALLLGGAADYITKPFETAELLARIAVQLRRQAVPGGEVYAWEDLRMEDGTHTVTVAGKAVSLTKTEYALLKLFLRDPGRVLSKSVILDSLFEDTPDCTESSLKTHVSHLRSKLRSAGGRDYIESVWGIGFKLG